MNSWNWALQLNRSLRDKPPTSFLFRQNFLLLIACFAFAIILWMYVAGDEPDTDATHAAPHDASAQVEFKNSRYRVLSVDRSSVTVTWQSRGTYGSRALISASADLANITSPGRYSVLIRPQVSWETGVSNVTVTPDHVTVFVDNVETRSEPVTFRPLKRLPGGYISGKPVLRPENVTITGPASLLPNVRPVITTDLTNHTDDLDSMLLVQVDGVDDADEGLFQVWPARVRLYLPVQHELGYTTVPVNPTITGSPAAGVTFLRASAEPSTLTVSGPPPVLQALSFISTAPIVLDKHTASFDLHVKVVPPPDVRVESSMDVLVKVVLAPRAVILPPSGSAAAGGLPVPVTVRSP